MRRALLSSWVGLLGVLVLAGCSGFPTGSGGAQNPTAPFSMTLRDTPPLGTEVVAFNFTITQADLVPSDGSPNVHLIVAPVTVEMTQLQSEATFLNSVSVPIKTFNSLNITLANPDLFLLNVSGGPVGANCPNFNVCEFKPSLSPVIITATNPVFPLTTMANIPVGVEMDVNIQNMIDNNVSINLGAPMSSNFAQLPVVQPTAQLAEIDNVLGSVQSFSAPSFTLQTANGQLLTIATDGNTQFDSDDAICPTNPPVFACLAVGQILDVNLSLRGDGTFQAKRVDFEDALSNHDAIGTILAVGPGAVPTQFKMLVHTAVSSIPTTSPLPVGDLVTFTIQNGTTFLFDANQFALPANASFSSAANLLIGQEVRVRVIETTVNAVTTFSTNEIDLHASQVTGLVGSVNAVPPSAPTFTLTNLPVLFPANPPLQVQTNANTIFENLTPNSFSGLVAQSTITTAEGLLFNINGTPTVAARKVRGH